MGHVYREHANPSELIRPGADHGVHSWNSLAALVLLGNLDYTCHDISKCHCRKV